MPRQFVVIPWEKMLWEFFFIIKLKKVKKGQCDDQNWPDPFIVLVFDIEFHQEIKRNVRDEQSSDEPHCIVLFSDLDEEPEKIVQDATVAVRGWGIDVSADDDHQTKKEPRDQELSDLSGQEGRKTVPESESITG